MRGRVDVFEGLFDGLRGNIKHESHADGGGKVLKITSTEEERREGVCFIFILNGEVSTFRGELVFSDVEVGLRVGERVGFNRGALFELKMFLDMGIV